MSTDPINAESGLSLYETKQIQREHREFRSIMSDLVTNFARMEGKIDTQTVLLERVTMRQDKGEQKVEEVERQFREEIRRLEDRTSAAVTVSENKAALAVNAAEVKQAESQKEVEKKVNALQKTVYMAMGGVIIASFLINLGIQLWKTMG